ncbi:ead/Ea22-like family protein [Escherichia coli]|nr:ead/Ea22-like family protein [Escherichia coli O115]EFB2131072.1 ead/Ea22-like family protein [Escherichia coli]EFH5552342.1 ead/Ea22-like family protein [Escherichia coli]HBJ0234834.1 ead/Ea22-like family protein [Escherichia coli]HDH9114408.1 ead/Ea22-like family protein [Escherichia coli]
MSKIDYQVLREAAVAIETVATPQKLLAFRMKVTPQVVLALLDERDALNERLAELEADLAGLAEDHQKATESIKQADAAVKLAHEKFSALAAENAMLKQRTQQLIDIISNTDNDYCMCGSAMKDHVHSGCGYPTGMFDYYYNQWLESDNKTPATDALLAEVRAQGVDMARNAMIDFVDGEVGPNKNVPGLIRGAEICVSIAEQLRKGGNQ